MTRCAMFVDHMGPYYIAKNSCMTCPIWVCVKLGYKASTRKGKTTSLIHTRIAGQLSEWQAGGGMRALAMDVWRHLDIANIAEFSRVCHGSLARTPNCTWARGHLQQEPRLRLPRHRA